jgi:hypothetical protein
MEKAELTFAVFLAAFGLVQTGANIYHLTRGSKAKIALSSMSMHGELPRDLPDGQYVAKAWIMLGFGLSFPRDVSSGNSRRKLLRSSRALAARHPSGAAPPDFRHDSGSHRLWAALRPLLHVCGGVNTTRSAILYDASLSSVR